MKMLSCREVASATAEARRARLQAWKHKLEAVLSCGSVLFLAGGSGPGSPLPIYNPAVQGWPLNNLLDFHHA